MCELLLARTPLQLEGKPAKNGEGRTPVDVAPAELQKHLADLHIELLLGRYKVAPRQAHPNPDPDPDPDPNPYPNPNPNPDPNPNPNPNQVLAPAAERAARATAAAHPEHRNGLVSWLHIPKCGSSFVAALAGAFCLSLPAEHSAELGLGLGLG